MCVLFWLLFPRMDVASTQEWLVQGSCSLDAGVVPQHAGHTSVTTLHWVVLQAATVATLVKTAQS